ncbi:2-(1,2-epoxy-1,2-dihydrophenyl)acetyl-CoA isomerase PaaG [Saccharospirillum sp.]|uniref:2-(1,2-epoxy-1,2-dihydrophenyl)acetyl-CoA isomerase PaaG n=1 Tax=Saccharospirillum sp. TaxID=2033801 RepID=UPI0034A05B86
MALITLDIRDGLATLTLNRPDKLNSLNLAMHAELASALDRVEATTTLRCLWLRANGRAFCVGQDLEERRALLDNSAPPDLGESLEQRYNPLIRRLSQLHCPTLCSVTGAAAGAGVGLALACDIVIAARSARFIFAFSRLGLGPDAGTSYRLPKLIGDARARGLMLLGEELDAATAMEWGLIWSCLDDEKIDTSGEKIAHQLAQAPTRGLNLCRQALSASGQNTLNDQLDLERDLQRQAGRTDDYREGITAFLEKRTAHFTGS